MRSAREASSSSDGTQRVSLKDIADELGISQTTVSFAINDRPGVSAETKRRVKEAAARLGWTPVYAAQALGSSKTMTIGFAPARSMQGLTDESFMLHFMAGVHASLSPKGYGLLYRPCRSSRSYRRVPARRRRSTHRPPPARTGARRRRCTVARRPDWRRNSTPTAR